MASNTLIARLAIATLQACGLVVLTSAASTPMHWPATDRAVFEPALLVVAFVPNVLLFGVNQIRPRPLAVWAAASAIVIAALGFHDAVRGLVPPYGGAPSVWPRMEVWLTFTVSLFVAHALVVDSVVERRLVPSYSRHFDTAWKQGVQLVLAIGFLAVFWALLFLGAGLFDLLELHFFRRLIEHRWFAWPATTLALAASIHVTDVEPALIRGARSLALTLFSWLLPVLACILGIFLMTLPFISLKTLWATHFATRLLLVAAASLVLLINSAYQDGAAERTCSRIKRAAGSLGALELFPLTALAISALSQRVGQYGWTVERILAGSAAAIIACYALGYAVASFPRRAWLKPIEITNDATAYFALAVFLALFSPLADPGRLMVASQIARLKSGIVPPERFDFVSLKFDGARWGTNALNDLAGLKDTGQADSISHLAAEALAAKSRYDNGIPNGLPALTPAQVKARIRVMPPDHKVPDEFYQADFWRHALGYLPPCVNNVHSRMEITGEPGDEAAASSAACLLRFVSLGPGSPDSIIAAEGWQSQLFQSDSNGQWKLIATLERPVRCAGNAASIEKDEIILSPHPWPDLQTKDGTWTIITFHPNCQ